jgi:D5-like protein
MISEDALATQVCQLICSDWKYTHEWKQWHQYNGVIWLIDDTLEIESIIRTAIRSICLPLSTDAETFLSWRTLKAIKRLCQSDRRIAMSNGQWDANTHFLATPVGIVDLFTCKICPFQREFYQTNMVSFWPAQFPKWVDFIAAVQKDNPLLSFELDAALRQEQKSEEPTK